jgi:D-beta-D-heptose 7-phosphate kinase / D-beta-D-heptose 1-phosphate adenosyltransferase
MNAELLQLIDAVAGLRVAVLGEAMLDSYVEGSVGRFCQEAPVPVVAVSGRTSNPGGAANTAVNVRGLGGQVTFLSVTGDDAEAASLRQALEANGVSCDGLIACPGRRTLAKNRVLAASRLLLRFDQGDTGPVGGGAERALIERLSDAFVDCDAVIVSDYAYGVVTPRVRRALADLQARHRRVLVADSRRLDFFRGVGLTAAKPNFEEAARLLGGHALEGTRGRAEAVAAQGERLLELTGARVVAATLDADGALIVERGRPPHRVPAGASRQACVVGAGDTFTAGLALALAAGAPAAAAGEFAGATAAVVVGKDRTATCTAAELREHVGAGGKYVGDHARLAARAEFYRQQGRRVVFTNGCFDILHRGHITYLNRARALGDVLIVGVNSDASIRRLKGPERPINTLEDRLQVLAALSCVDHLTAFDDDTPCALIRAVRPDVFVKGGDYTRERLPEAPLVEALGGVVQILPFVADRSTTGLIRCIRAAEAVGGAV